MSDTAVQTIHGSYLMPSLEHATVADAHPGIPSCEPDATLAEVAQMIATHHVHCVAVVGISHEAPECFVWGIVSDLDLRKSLADFIFRGAPWKRTARGSTTSSGPGLARSSSSSRSSAI